MYDFLNYISEIVERYSWVIVPSVVGGALAVFLLWGAVPKLKAKAISTNTYRIIKITFQVVGLSLIWGAVGLDCFLGLGTRLLPISITGLACVILGAWVL